MAYIPCCPLTLTLASDYNVISPATSWDIVLFLIGPSNDPASFLPLARDIYDTWAANTEIYWATIKSFMYTSQSYEIKLNCFTRFYEIISFTEIFIDVFSSKSPSHHAVMEFNVQKKLSMRLQ